MIYIYITCYILHIICILYYNIYMYYLPRDMEHMSYSFSTIIFGAALKIPMIVVYWWAILLIHRGCVAISNHILRSQ